MDIITIILFALRALGLTSGDSNTDANRAKEIYEQGRYQYIESNNSIKLDDGFVILDEDGHSN